jgi:hypothetical protein
MTKIITSTVSGGTAGGHSLSNDNSGDQTITLTGGVTGSGTGSFVATVVTNANLIGDVTSVGNTTTLANAPVIAKVLTGYTSGAGTVAATDTILQAIQKLNGNDATNANLTGPITSVGNATSVASQTGTGTKFVMDTDPTLTGTPLAPTAAAATNTTQIATTAFVLAAVSTAVAGLLNFKGATDCSANPNYPAAAKGDAYIVSVAGKVGGASGTSVDVGDWYVATAANAGGTEASVGTSWGHMEHNLVGALLASNNLSDLASASTARSNLGLGALATVTAGTGIATALAVNVGTAGAPVINGGALGTPSSGTVTNLTGTGSININGTVGATTPTTGSFTTVTASGLADISGASAGQIKFPATQNASANANTLDDYAEGTFTPGITFGAAAVGMTFTTQTGEYTKIGNRVFFSCTVTLSAKGSSTGAALLTGLPFTVGSSATPTFPMAFRASPMTSGVNDQTISAFVVGTTTTVRLDKFAAAAQGVTQMADTDFLANSSISISGHYRI